MFCKNCNLVFAEDLKFCTSCGERLVDPELLAILPEEERDTVDVINLLTLRLIVFSAELIGKNPFNFEDMEEQMDMMSSFFDGDMEKYEKLRAVVESDSRVEAKKKELLKNVNDCLDFIKENLWLFDATNYILLKAGKPGLDMERLNLKGMNIREVDEITDNWEKMEILDDFDLALYDYLMDVSDFATEVGERLDELEEGE